MQNHNTSLLRTEDVPAPHTEDVSATNTQDVSAPHTKDVFAPDTEDASAPHEEDVAAPHTGCRLALLWVTPLRKSGAWCYNNYLPCVTILGNLVLQYVGTFFTTPRYLGLQSVGTLFYNR